MADAKCKRGRDLPCLPNKRHKGGSLPEQMGDINRSLDIFRASDSIARFCLCMLRLRQDLPEENIGTLDPWSFEADSFTEVFRSEGGHVGWTWRHRWTDVDPSFRVTWLPGSPHNLVQMVAMAWTNVPLSWTTLVWQGHRSPREGIAPEEGQNLSRLVKACMDKCNRVVEGLVRVFVQGDRRELAAMTSLAMALRWEAPVLTMVAAGAVDVNQINSSTGDPFLIHLMKQPASGGGDELWFSAVELVAQHYFGRGLDIYAQNSQGSDALDVYLAQRDDDQDPYDPYDWEAAGYLDSSGVDRMATVPALFANPEPHQLYQRAFCQQASQALVDLGVPDVLVSLIATDYCWWPMDEESMAPCLLA